MSTVEDILAGLGRQAVYFEFAKQQILTSPDRTPKASGPTPDGIAALMTSVPSYTPQPCRCDILLSSLPNNITETLGDTEREIEVALTLFESSNRPMRSCCVDRLQRLLWRQEEVLRRLEVQMAVRRQISRHHDRPPGPDRWQFNPTTRRYHQDFRYEAPVDVLQMEDAAAMAALDELERRVQALFDVEPNPDSFVESCSVGVNTDAVLLSSVASRVHTHVVASPGRAHDQTPSPVRANVLSPRALFVDDASFGLSAAEIQQTAILERQLKMALEQNIELEDELRAVQRRLVVAASLGGA